MSMNEPVDPKSSTRYVIPPGILTTQQGQARVTMRYPSCNNRTHIDLETDNTYHTEELCIHADSTRREV